MSLATARQAFADALSTVDGIRGYTSPPPTMHPGAAWARLSNMDSQGAPGLFTVTWDVLVISGGVPGQVEPFLDEHLAGITDALAPIAFVTAVNPTAITTPSGDLFGVMLTTIRE